MKAWWNSQLRNSILRVYKKPMERSRIPPPLVWLVLLRPTVNSRSYIFSSSWETSYYFEYYDICVLLIHDLYTLGFIYCDRQCIKVYVISSPRTSCLQSSAISKLGCNSRTTNNYDAVVFLQIYSRGHLYYNHKQMVFTTSMHCQRDYPKLALGYKLLCFSVSFPLNKKIL